jgi:hypothetical protein
VELLSCIRRKPRPDIRIRIPAIVIRIPRPGAGIRPIIPIAARDKPIFVTLQPEICRAV